MQFLFLNWNYGVSASNSKMSLKSIVDLSWLRCLNYKSNSLILKLVRGIQVKIKIQCPYKYLTADNLSNKCSFRITTTSIALRNEQEFYIILFGFHLMCTSCIKWHFEQVPNGFKSFFIKKIDYRSMFYDNVPRERSKCLSEISKKHNNSLMTNTTNEFNSPISYSPCITGSSSFPMYNLHHLIYLKLR